MIKKNSHGAVAQATGAMRVFFSARGAKSRVLKKNLTGARGLGHGLLLGWVWGVGVVVGNLYAVHPPHFVGNVGFPIGFQCFHMACYVVDISRKYSPPPHPHPTPSPAVMPTAHATAQEYTKNVGFARLNLLKKTCIGPVAWATGPMRVCC